MTSIDNLTVTVNAVLTVSDEMAQRCIQMLAMWLDDNPDKSIMCKKEPCGGDGDV